MVGCSHDNCASTPQWVCLAKSAISVALIFYCWARLMLSNMHSDPKGIKHLGEY